MQSEKLPLGWKKTPLRSLTNNEDGLLCDGDWVESKDQSPDGDVRLIQLADIGDGSYLDKSSRFLTSDTAATLRCTYLQPGDILVARMPDPIGRACIFPGDKRPSVTAVDVCIVRVSGQTNNRWLLAAINSLSSRQWIEKKAAGTTRTRIASRELAVLELLIPPKDQQDRIAEIIDSIDNTIRATRAVIEQTRQLKAALLQDLLTKGLPGRHKKFKNVRGLGRIPADWDVFQLGRLTTLVTSGSRGWSKYLVDSGPFFVRSQNIGLGTILRDDVAYVDPPRDQEAERARIQPGDLLISITGEPGNVVQADESLGEAYVSQHVALVRLENPTLSPWITLALSAPVGQTQFRSKMYGQTRPGLNLDNIDELEVPFPDENEQISCCELINAVEERLTSNTQQLRQLESCKVVLSQGLLTGRIRVDRKGCP
jgi:type I restriction enzyme S subunit